MKRKGKQDKRLRERLKPVSCNEIVNTGNIWLTIKDASERYSRARQTILDWIKEGKLNARTHFGLIVVRAKDVKKQCRRQSNGNLRKG